MAAFAGRDPQLAVDRAALELYLEIIRDAPQSAPRPDAGLGPAPASGD
jgi:hypothetical protein